MTKINTESRAPVWTFTAFDGKEFPIYELEDHEITQGRLERLQLALQSLNRGWSLETWANNLKELQTAMEQYNDFASGKQFEQAIFTIVRNVPNAEDFSVINNLIEGKATQLQITQLQNKLKTVPTSEELAAANLMLKAYAANKTKNENIAKLALKLVSECIQRNDTDFVNFNPEYDLICSLFVTANEDIENPSSQLQSLKKQLFFWDTEGLLLLKKKSEPKLLKHSILLVDYFPNVFQIILQSARAETLKEIFQ